MEITFLAIEDLNGGRDGRVWLVIDPDNEYAAVIKFSNDKTPNGQVLLQVII